MKQYSTNAYYNYAKRLLESDNSDSTETIKAGDSHVGKLIIGASAGATGAVACLKYLDDTFSISSLTTATTKLSDIAKEAATEGTGIFKRILGKLSGMVGIAISWVQKACSGILEKFPSLKKPIFNNTTTGGPTYGSVLCMALVAAAVCTVLYKIYKFIKGRRNKTESVAMYNFRKNYELSVMLDETAMFFNRLDRLIEANPADVLRKKSADFDAKEYEKYVNRMDKSAYNNDQFAGKQMERNRINAEKELKAYQDRMHNQAYDNDQAAGKLMRDYNAQKEYEKKMHDIADKNDQLTGERMRQNVKNAAEEKRLADYKEKQAIAKRGLSGYADRDPNQVKDAQDQAEYEKRMHNQAYDSDQEAGKLMNKYNAKQKALQAAKDLEKKQTTQLSGYGKQSAASIYTKAINNPNYKNSPELQNIAAQAKQVMSKPEAVKYTVRPTRSGKVSISSYNNNYAKDSGSGHGDMLGNVVVSQKEADNLIALSKKTGFDPVTISNLSKNHTPKELNTILNNASKNGMDPNELSAMANRYKGNPDPNAARMNYSKVHQDTLDKIQATKVKNTEYMQMSNGKINARYTDPVTGEKTFTTMTKAEVPKDAKIVSSPKLLQQNTTYTQLSNGKVHAITKDPITGKVTGKMIDRNAVPKNAEISKSPKLQKIANERAGVGSGEDKLLSKTNDLPKNAGSSPEKAGSFIESVQGKANTMWETSKQWCKDNPKLITIVAIIAALIACWVGVKKYKDSKAKKQASQQTAAATA